MYSSTNYVHYAQSQSNVNLKCELSGTPYTTLSPMNLSLSQPTTPQMTHLPPETQHDSQPHTGNPVPTSTEQQWKTVSRKRSRKTEGQDILNENRQAYWLGGPIPITNRFNSLSEEQMEEANNQSPEPKPPPIFISGVRIYNL